MRTVHPPPRTDCPTCTPTSPDDSNWSPLGPPKGCTDRLLDRLLDAISEGVRLGIADHLDRNPDVLHDERTHP